MKKLIKSVLVLATLLISFNASAELKIGYVELNQIMQSQPALDVGKKLQSEFATRISIEFERKQRELNEDASLRKNEELKKFQDQINKVIDSITQTEGYDLILYNGAAFTSKKINITDKVISAIGK